MIKPSYVYKAVATRVIDGDTVDTEIDLGFHVKFKARLRLARIDTPEMNDTDPAIRAKALAAKLAVEGLVLRKDLLVVTTKSDLYGRFLAEVFVTNLQKTDMEQTNVSDWLLTNHYAEKY